MKRYGYDLNAVHSAAIFEAGSEAANGKHCIPKTSGLIVGTSEWIWLDENSARRICAALTYFSETTTEEIERLADERFEMPEQSIGGNNRFHAGGAAGLNPGEAPAVLSPGYEYPGPSDE